MKAVLFVFFVACGGTVSTGDDADVAPDVAQGDASPLEAATSGDASDVAVSDGDAAIPLCPVACNPETFVVRCCIDSIDDSGASIHVCSDAGIPVATSTCGQ